MLTFKTEKPPVVQPLTVGDIRLASIAFGWTLGFGLFVVFRAVKQSLRLGRLNTYLVLCWLEILACTIIAVICYLIIVDIIKVQFWLLFFVLCCWTLQVQCLLQIIVNRICILIPSYKKRTQLKVSVALIVSAICVSVFCIWIPAKLQISERYIRLNNIWDRVEKCLYLVIDGALNYYFIEIVKRRLLANGLKKYDKLVRFNTGIIWVSLGMDVLIIGMMSYKNDAVYMGFHPVAYMVKLQIEMSMSDLIVAVAQSTGVNVYEGEHAPTSRQLSSGNGTTAVISKRSIEVRMPSRTTRGGNDVELYEHELDNSDVWDRKRPVIQVDIHVENDAEKGDLERADTRASSDAIIVPGSGDAKHGNPAVHFANGQS